MIKFEQQSCGIGMVQVPRDQATILLEHVSCHLAAVLKIRPFKVIELLMSDLLLTFHFAPFLEIVFAAAKESLGIIPNPRP